MSDHVSAGQAPLLTMHGAVGRISLRRPAAANRIEAADLPVLQALVAQVATTSSVRVLVLQSGGRHFCAGYDVSDLQRMADGASTQATVNPFGAVVDALHALDKPTVAAVHAGVYGGAIDLALACDFRIGTSRCEMFMPALKIGLQYYASGLERWVSRLGLQNTRLAFMTGATFDAAAMQRMGALDALYGTEEALRTAVDELAGQLAAMAPIPMASTKRALEQIALARLDRDAVQRAELAALCSSDLREGIDAMKARRAPQFEGR